VVASLNAAANGDALKCCSALCSDRATSVAYSAFATCGRMLVGALSWAAQPSTPVPAQAATLEGIKAVIGVCEQCLGRAPTGVPPSERTGRVQMLAIKLLQQVVISLTVASQGRRAADDPTAPLRSVPPAHPIFSRKQMAPVALVLMKRLTKFVQEAAAQGGRLATPHIPPVVLGINALVAIALRRPQFSTRVAECLMSMMGAGTGANRSPAVLGSVGVHIQGSAARLRKSPHVRHFLFCFVLFCFVLFVRVFVWQMIASVAACPLLLHVLCCCGCVCCASFPQLTQSHPHCHAARAIRSPALRNVSSSCQGWSYVTALSSPLRSHAALTFALDGARCMPFVDPPHSLFYVFVWRRWLCLFFCWQHLPFDSGKAAATRRRNDARPTGVGQAPSHWPEPRRSPSCSSGPAALHLGAAHHGGG